VGQREASITADAEVSVQLLLIKVIEAGSRHTTRVGAQHPIEEALKETHGKGPLLPRRTQWDSQDNPRPPRRTAPGSPPAQAIPRTRPTPRPQGPKPTSGTVAF